MTFSIVGRCEKTGQLGIAISSSSIAVGARCPWMRAGVGAVATQGGARLESSGVLGGLFQLGANGVVQANGHRGGHSNLLITQS